MLTDDFKKRAKAKLETASAGKFFQSNCARLLPSFDRGDIAAADGCEESNELSFGVKLGEGAFCDVKEITAIVLKRKSNGNGEHSSNGNEKEKFLPKPRQKSSNLDSSITDEADFPVNLFQNKSEIRKYMSENCIRKDDIGRDHSRYALKHLKPTNMQKQLEQGLIDISIEAQFLSCFNHPNVIKMRGVAGEPLTPEFGLVLDRLYLTLEDKMDIWNQEKKMATSSGLCGCLFGSVDSATKSALVFSAITVAYDLACALRYIHSNNLVYRDVKPENAGFDVRGDIKLFDFGFCKELTKNLFDKPSGLYKLTKMTGSPPYMAPENFLGKPYGKSADVFSFGVLLWEMLHSKFAFYHYNKQDYKDVVVEKNYRPSIDNSLSARMKEFIKESWDPNPKKRPTFDRICLLLSAEYQELSMEDNEELTRSAHMLGASTRSFRARSKK